MKELRLQMALLSDVSSNVTWEQLESCHDFGSQLDLLPWQPNFGAMLRLYLVNSCFHFSFHC